MKKIVLFGPPGAGKGTFSSQIKTILPNIVHISTGDLFRENVKNQTSIGLNAKDYINKGHLVPDDIVIDLVRETLNREDVKKHGFILDGFPRTLNQAEALSKIVEIDLFLLLEVSKKVLMQRILGRFSCQKCGRIYNKYTYPPNKNGLCDNCGTKMEFIQRMDDNERAAKERLKQYDKNAKSIIRYYEKQDGVFKVVNTEHTLDLTEEQIKEIIGI